MNLDITIQDDGFLLLAADQEMRTYVRQLVDKREPDDSILWQIMEVYWANGGYEPFDAGQANPFVGLTSAVCIAEAMDTHDDGSKEIVGRFWYFGNYMLESPSETLADTGRVVFELARQDDSTRVI